MGRERKEARGGEENERHVVEGRHIEEERGGMGRGGEAEINGVQGA